MQFTPQFAPPQIWLRGRTEAEKFAPKDLLYNLLPPSKSDNLRGSRYCRKPYLPPAGSRAWGVPLNLLPEGEPPLVFAAARSAYGLKLLPLYPPPSFVGGGSAEPEPASLLGVKSSVLRFLPDCSELFLPEVLGWSWC